jgi:hypothetical protein
MARRAGNGPICVGLAVLVLLCGCRKGAGGDALADAAVAAALPDAAPSDDFWQHTRALFAVPVGDSPVLGGPGALVTIVEFADFASPACGGVEPTLSALRAKYGDAIRLVWKNAPPAFQPAAEPAAEAALEVRAERGDAAFWAVHDRLLAQRLTDGGAADVEATSGSRSRRARGEGTWRRRSPTVPTGRTSKKTWTSGRISTTRERCISS